MSELTDCTNSLTAKDIIKSIAKTANGVPFYLQTSGAGAFSASCAQYQAIYDAYTTPPDTADALIDDGVTCIDLDKHSFEENCSLIRQYSEPGEYSRMSQRARKRFDEVVNYDKELYKIKDFLRRLQ